jgi:hypothetical protein
MVQEAPCREGYNNRQSTPTDWGTSQFEGEDPAEVQGPVVSKPQPGSVNEESGDEDVDARAADDSLGEAVPAAEESDSENDAMLADESMNIVYETPPVTQSTHEQSSQLNPKSPRLSQFHHRTDNQEHADGDTNDLENAQVNSSMVVETSIPFPTPAQRGFGTLATPKKFDSSPIRVRDDRSSPVRLPDSSQAGADRGLQPPFISRVYKDY